MSTKCPQGRLEPPLLSSSLGEDKSKLVDCEREREGVEAVEEGEQSLLACLSCSSISYSSFVSLLLDASPSVPCAKSTSDRLVIGRIIRGRFLFLLPLLLLLLMLMLRRGRDPEEADEATMSGSLGPCTIDFLVYGPAFDSPGSCSVDRTTMLLLVLVSWSLLPERAR